MAEVGGETDGQSWTVDGGTGWGKETQKDSERESGQRRREEGSS